MGKVTKPDCVIFAAGNRVEAKKVAPYLTGHPFVITADGGYRLAVQIGCTPDLILGDFDSMDCPKTDIPTIRLNPVKDDTDTAYALKTAMERGYQNIVLFGGTGSRLDHTFANFYLSAYAKAHNVQLTIVDEHHEIFALQNETQRIEKNSGQYVSVFPVGGPCTLTLSGFYYPLEHYPMGACSGLGVSNEVKDDFADITVESGTALIFVTDKD